MRDHSQDFTGMAQNVAVPITLSDEQVKSVCQLAGFGGDEVRRVLEGINDVLTGDPIGTIRRSPDGRVIAVRVKDLDRPWEMCIPGGSASYRASSVHTWPVIFRPEEA